PPSRPSFPGPPSGVGSRCVDPAVPSALRPAAGGNPLGSDCPGGATAIEPGTGGRPGRGTEHSPSGVRSAGERGVSQWKTRRGDPGSAYASGGPAYRFAEAPGTGNQPGRRSAGGAGAGNRGRSAEATVSAEAPALEARRPAGGIRFRVCVVRAQRAG